MTNRLTEFQGEPVTFVETLNVKDGVICDVYSYNDNKKDLGIITVSPNSCTPLQKVLKGDKTIEGYISGVGTLTITKANGEIDQHTPHSEGEEFIVNIGETMQWCTGDEELHFYEICYPPYEDGRYENLIS